MVLKNWLRNSAAALIVSAAALVGHAQTLTWTKSTLLAQQNLSVTVVAISNEIAGQPMSTRDVVFQYSYTSTSQNNQAYCTAINVNSSGGTIIGFGSSPTGAVTGSVVKRMQFLPEPLPGVRWRAHMLLGADTVYFYADAFYTFTLSFENNKNEKVTYTVLQNGKPMGFVTLEPGEKAIANYKSTDSTPLTVTETLWETTILGGEAITAPRTVGETVPGTIPGLPGTTPGTATPVTPLTPAPGGAVTDPKPGGDAGKPIWDATKNGTSSPALSEAIFKQGIDAVVVAIKAGGGSGGTGGTVTVNVSGVETRLDTTNTRLNEIKTKVTDVEGNLKGADIVIAGFDETTDKVFAPIATQATGLTSKLPAAPVITAPAAHAGTFSIPLSFYRAGTVTALIDFRPYETQIGVVKGIIRAVFAVLFFFLSLRAIKEAFA